MKCQHKFLPIGPSHCHGSAGETEVSEQSTGTSLVRHRGLGDISRALWSTIMMVLIAFWILYKL